METLRDWLYSLCWGAFTGFDKAVADSVETLTDGLVIGGWSKMLDMSKHLRPFCAFALGLVVMYEIYKTYSRVDTFKWEMVLNLGIKVIFSKVCIDVVPSFLKACYLQSQEWISAIGSENTEIGKGLTEPINELIYSTDSFWTILGMFLTTFILILAVKICGLIIQAIALGRIFEIFIYLVVSPFPCVFMPLGNSDGSGIGNITVRFLKTFIAVCLQGLVMVIALKVFGLIMLTMVDNVINSVNMNDTAVALTDLMFAMLLGSVALVMSVIKSGSLSKNLIDTM